MPPDAHTIAIAEPDDAARTFLADNLTADGYDVLTSAGFEEALLRSFPDALIVDTRRREGLALVDAARHGDGVHGDAAVAILALGNGGGSLDAIRALERGADDHLGRPFSYPELRLRVRRLIDRRERPSAPGRRIGPLAIDTAARRVTLDGEPVELTNREFLLLCALAAEPTRVFTKQELLRDVWGFRSSGTTRTLDSHACRLRSKLSRGEHRFIANVWGVGYRLSVDAAR